ncbi:MAG: hypothetical protein WA991_17515 [Ornithinimicrobium sp.]
MEHIHAVGGVIGFPAVHIGQAVMGCGGKIDYLVDTVLNYPTLLEAYKVAALDVANKRCRLRGCQQTPCRCSID